MAEARFHFDAGRGLRGLWLSLLLVLACAGSLRAQLIPSSAVQEGDMILTRSASARSMFTAAIDGTGEFAHAGIIAFIKGEPYVVTALPMNIHGDLHDHGRIACIPLEDYLRRDRYTRIAIFRIQAAHPSQRQKATQLSLLWFLQKIPFDTSFDLTNDDRLYCTEMIWKAYERAGFQIIRLESLRNRDRITQPIIYPSDLLKSPAVRFIGELAPLPYRAGAPPASTPEIQSAL